MRARRSERGAVAVLAVATSLLVIAIAAFTVDLGMQRVARTDMQSLADIISLDLARELGSRSVDDFEDDSPTIQQLAEASRDRNTGTLGSVPVVTPTLGQLDLDGDFVEVSGDEVPTAVRVAASTEVQFAFGIASSGSAERSATSRQTQDAACFELGSFAAALDLGDSVLGPFADLLGLETALDIASYKSLLGADVSLLGIAAAPSIGSPEALLNPSGVSVGNLIQATIFALEHDGDAGSTSSNAAVSVLNGLLQSGSGLDLGGSVVIPDVVGVSAGDMAALAAGLNVLELVGTSLAIANGEDFLNTQVPINLSSVGLGTGSLTISATQRPRFACGRPWPSPGDDCATIRDNGGACARQSQVSFALQLNPVTVPLVPLSGFSAASIGVNATIGPVSLAGGVGNAKAVLTSVDRCGPPDQITVNTRSGLLGVDLAVPISVDGSVALDLTVLPAALQDLVGNLLNLPGLISGLFGGFQYEYRAYRVAVGVQDASATLRASSEGMTNMEEVPLESPTNDRSGTAVRVPDPPEALALGTLSVPANLLSGKVTVRLSYEWRRRSTTLLGIPTGSWSSWKLNTETPPPGASNGALFTGDLGNLGSVAGLPTPLVGLGGVIDGALAGITSALNTQVVGAVNQALGGTLLPLLGLSGSGADLHSVSRPLCGGPPQIVD